MSTLPRTFAPAHATHQTRAAVVHAPCRTCSPELSRLLMRAMRLATMSDAELERYLGLVWDAYGEAHHA